MTALHEMKREIRFLKVYAFASTLLLLFLFITAFTVVEKGNKFEEIDVERINIVEKDGQLKMVISNQARQHPGISNGKIIERDYPRPPGILFFNQLGDEMGGLIYGANGDSSHFGSLTWDKVRGDQTMGFRHLEGDNGRYMTGIEMWQQPTIPVEEMIAKIDSVRAISNQNQRKQAFKELRKANLITTRRLFLGKLRDDSSLLELLDSQGRSRLVAKVDADGKAQLLFYDTNGEVVHRIPED